MWCYRLGQVTTIPPLPPSPLDPDNLHEKAMRMAIHVVSGTRGDKLRIRKEPFVFSAIPPDGVNVERKSQIIPCIHYMLLVLEK